METGDSLFWLSHVAASLLPPSGKSRYGAPVRTSLLNMNERVWMYSHCPALNRVQCATFCIVNAPTVRQQPIGVYLGHVAIR